MKENIVEKLKKILALAGNNPSEEEAQAAMAKAQAMAIEYGIDLALLGNDPDKDQIIQEVVEQGNKRLPTVATYVTSILSTFFNIRVVSSGNRESGRNIIFIGKKSDVDTAKYIYKWLSNTMIGCWKLYYHNTPGLQLAHKQSYLLGFYRGLHDRLTQNKAKIEKDRLITTDDRSRYALAVVDLKKQIQLYMDKVFNKLRNAPVRNVTVYSNSYQRGVTDGSNCQIANRNHVAELT